jgi:hypothetical protein
MTYTYIASTNTLKQVLAMERPNASDYRNRRHAYATALERYQEHLASLKEIACDESCKEVWKDGQEVVEGVDFKVVSAFELEQGGVYDPIAIPVKAESEDEYETWREMFTLFVNRFVVAENATANIGDAIKVFRKEYFISKIK